jgi:hypothetical protein
MAEDIVDNFPSQSLAFALRERDLFLVNDRFQFVFDELMQFGFIQR